MQQTAPLTETDCWRAIESLGGSIWAINHDLADGRGQPGDEEALGKLQARIEPLVDETCRRFGIAHPQREGQDPSLKPYWTWYEATKASVLGEEYDATVCASCPFARSKGHHISLGGTDVPCDLFSGFMRRTPEELAVGCPLVAYNAEWGYEPQTVEQLVALARDRHGDGAADGLAARLGHAAVETA
jgi:hypothetical protein